MPTGLKRSGPEASVSVAVVYDSGSRSYPALSGRTRVVAEAVARGAEAVESTVVDLVPAADGAATGRRWTRRTRSSSAARPTWARVLRR